MAEVQEKPTLSFDGKNYVIDDLSDKARYLVSQLQDLIQQANATRARRLYRSLPTALAGPLHQLLWSARIFP